MAKDHYISQVHLKNFYASSLARKKMFALRKSEPAWFFCGSEDVCRVEDGSTNPFLPEPRIAEEFLRSIEPFYNRACDALFAGELEGEEVQIIAGFIAFVVSCSPSATRLGGSMIQKMVEAEVLLADREGLLPPPPESTGFKNASELVNAGLLNIEIAQKYPQAIGISNLSWLADSFIGSKWEILRNRDHFNTPFLTCDFPAAIEKFESPILRVVPLRPDLAVRIWPSESPISQQPQISDFRYRISDINKSEVRAINKATVICAENFVFSPIQSAGILKLVKKYSHKKLESFDARTEGADGWKVHSKMGLSENER